TVKGATLVGLRYRGPFDELEAQQGIDHHVVPWQAVGEDEGTGIVHIAPGCGAEDFTLSQVHDLPVLVPIDENGEYYASFGELAGKSTRAVRDDVFGSLRSKNMFFKMEEIEHRYPTCWRCGEEIVFRGVSEWFISCDEIRPRMIRAARTIDWIPSSAGKRMEDWLNNMGHWCISRKRYWGLPLPFYLCPQCDTLTVVGSVDELRNLAVSGMDEVKELHRPWIDAVHIRCPSCGGEVERITEVGDCWLDAGIVPFSTLGPGLLKDHAEWERWYPADWVSEMREQIRLWFYSMLFMSVAIEDQAPYKRVLTYEKLMDESGHPMHKSLGNAIWFDEAAERMGADVMRWLYAGQSITSNLLFGYKPAEEVRRKLITLWNVYSFYATYAEAEKYRPASGEARPHPSPLPEGEGTAGPSALSTQHSALSRMDRWIVSRLNGLVVLANDRLDAYDVATLADSTDRFVDDLSTWYLRRSRRRFSRDADPADREAAFNTLFHCLSTLMGVIAPIMPFIAEEIYQNIVRSVDLSAPDSVHLTPFPEANATAIDPALEEEMDLTRAIVTLGRAARSEAGTRVRQPLPAITIATGSGSIDLAEELRQEIADELNVREVRTAEKVDAFARRVVRPNPRLLGPRLGAAFQSVKQGLQDGTFTINPDGSVSVAGQTLASEEVAVTLEPLDNQSVAQDMQWHGGLAVALDRNVTPELRSEGLAREVVHRVQMMRRDAGLSVEDRISLDYRASPGLLAVLETHGDRIKREVGAVVFRRLDSLESTNGPDGESAQARIDGEDITLSLRTVE
ncbi:MAG: isoleucyl-tRNA synthetase, partial [Chloroflexi bacterium]|nr:isoleucyl-tRNA synthetase [Chloroflexota bacterium]